MVGYVLVESFRGRVAWAVGVVLTVGVTPLWNVLTFTLDEDGVRRGGVDPIQLFERFGLLWLLLGWIWLLALLLVTEERAVFRTAIAAVALAVCIVAAFVNAYGWWQVVAAV